MNHEAKRGELEPGGALFGKAFENFIHHEIRACSHYSERHHDIWYWRLSTGTDVDFILGDGETAVECKASSRIHDSELKDLRLFAAEHPEVRHRLVVCLESRARLTDDGIRILPVADFVKGLREGDWTPVR